MNKRSFKRRVEFVKRIKDHSKGLLTLSELKDLSDKIQDKKNKIKK